MIAGFCDIYLNGVKLANADFTATSGNSVILASPAAVNDILNGGCLRNLSTS